MLMNFNSFNQEQPKWEYHWIIFFDFPMDKQFGTSKSDKEDKQNGAEGNDLLFYNQDS